MNTRSGVLLTALLVGSGLATDPPKVTRVGEVSVVVTRISVPMLGDRDMVVGTGSFRPGSDAGGPLRSQDQCFVAEMDDGQAAPTGQPPGAASPAPGLSLDAGDPLTLRLGTQVYATLPRRQQGQVISYATDMPNPLKAPPAGLVLDIPGAAGGFPAMKDRALPTAALLRLTAPAAGDPVTPQTAFQWANPSNDPATQVMLSALDEERGLALTCLAVDDGAFSLPAATAADLKARGWGEGLLTTYGRMATRTYQQGDARLTLNSIVMQVNTGF
ncbi:hypothetical protein [Deinococcus sp. NW-56]|uniref:hypothetical protein n=1 Tax=Deinococcus sp. NW-56 TaxID=2080419 RepID=UPI00131A1E1D|nr:hypothetical protein [Deinococcus sp. NW-56]